MSGTLVLVYAMALAASFGLDAVAVPRAPLRRPWRAVLLHVAAVSFVGACVLIATSRPVFSAGIAAALVGLLAAISNAKSESLREPFVFTDLSLFSQLFAHPRLYLPFLSGGKVVAIAAGVVLLVAGCLLDHAVAPARVVATAVALACLPIGALLAGTGVKLFEITRDKKLVWKYEGPHRVHHFQVLTTNGQPLEGKPLK